MADGLYFPNTGTKGNNQTDKPLSPLSLQERGEPNELPQNNDEDEKSFNKQFAPMTNLGERNGIGFQSSF
jgi:hypothetical protein